jgi:sec-independent protein translocase protein TatA
MKLFEPQTLLIILAVVLVIFGPSRLPQLGKSLGKTMHALREGAEGKLGEDAEKPEPEPEAAADPTPVPKAEEAEKVASGAGSSKSE